MTDGRFFPAGRAGLLGLVLALTSCAAGDDYRRPDLDVPASFSAAAEEDLKAEPDWWTGFRSPGLDRVMAEAAGGNLDLKAAVARIRQADATLRVSGAQLLPTLDLSMDATRQKSAGTQGSGRVANAYGASLSTSYEIDFWSKNRYAQESAEALARASRFDWQTALMTVRASVATTYFAWLGARDQLAVARRNLANAEEVLAAIRDRQSLGMATSLEAVQQESVVAQARAAIPPLEQSVGQNRNALLLLTGRSAGLAGLPEENLESLAAPAVAAGLPSTLLERRPDVRYAEFRLISANADLGAARAALFPSLTLTAQYGFESLALSSLLNQGSALWSVAAGVTQPIFRGGALRGEVERQEGVYEELAVDYRQSVLSALSDTEDALIAVRQGAEKEKAQRAVVETARRSYDLSQDQMRAGTIDVLTLLDVQKTLFSAEDSLVQARLGHLQAIVGLVKALGGGWDGRMPEGVAEVGAVK